MKVAIVGSRDFDDYNLIMKFMDKIPDITLFVSGGAKGADTLGEVYADKHNIKKKIFHPEWNKYGKSAGFIRNQDIVKEAEFIIAFWDGKSPGTKSTIDLCKRYGKQCYVVKYKEI